MTEEIYPAPACECGAPLNEGQARCRKCLARDRWLKKQAGKRRGETRRPPRGPQSGGKAGVVWS
ncbi:hypothetical protein [Nonomuraea sp. NPDC046570]|uniref:hypothetical protein n=1 Tax=Nonomuraea sp. NPDC046570 TaxID=3155255 RepID=UPI0034071ACD